MTADQPSIAQLLDASTRWWEAAGVDLCFSDEPAVWLQASPPLAERVAPEGKAAPPPAQAPDTSADGQAPADLLGDTPPLTLADFRDYWLGAPAIYPGPLSRRVAPRGEINPALMVLVLDPEPEDSDTLLSGPQGALLAQILRAMGIARDAAYIASALPVHTPMADPPALAQSGMGAVLAHHIGLVQPEAVLAFGAGLAPLLAPDDAMNGMSLRENKHTPLVPPVFQCEALSSLAAMPRLKARFWRRWMEWSMERS